MVSSPAMASPAPTYHGEIHHAVRVKSEHSRIKRRNQIGHAARDQFPKTTEAWQTGTLHSSLSWTHYRTLLRVERQG